MSSATVAGPKTDWITELSRQDEPSARRALLKVHSAEFSPELVEELYEQVVALARVELKQAGHLAEAALAISKRLHDKPALAQGLRSVGHVMLLNGKYRSSLKHYEGALSIFKRLGRDLDTARTISGGMLQSLIYLGQYSRALLLATQARKIFTRRGDRLRLARLDSNQGNVLYRQDRFREAIRFYQRAYDYLHRAGDPQDVAIALRNMAVCYISLNRFPEALETYRTARHYCEQHNLHRLAAEADYNVAYLHYLRGEYTTAITLYDATRELCNKLGDPYHRALCDLDQAEMYLELNLSESGVELAESAFSGFRELHMDYEAAKALTFMAIAASHQGKAARSLQHFDEARELFLKENNRLWLALIDLYKALILFDQGRHRESRRLARSALEFFGASSLPAKAAICDLLLARLSLQSRLPRTAYKHCISALLRSKTAEAPAVGYQAYFVLGQVKEALKDPGGALWAYRQSHATLEDLRSHLLGEEVKIAFLKDKLAVYENLVWITLKTRPGAAGMRQALQYMEQAKSRSLADLIAFQAHALQPRSKGSGALAEHLSEVRDKLNWAYHQIELEELRGQKRSRTRIARLRQQTRAYEDDLVRTFGRIRKSDREFVELQNPEAVPVDAIIQSLPEDSLLLEYFHARDRFYVGILGEGKLEVVPLGRAETVRTHLRLLQFQLSKFRLGQDYVRTFGTSLRAAADFHLRELRRELIAPIRHLLEARHLVIVPHGFLHYLPFQALTDGQNCLCDEFSISYAPSASVFHLCASKWSRAGNRSLVLGIPDPLAPYIRDEAEYVASCLPNSALFLGEEAAEEKLRTHGPGSRFIHIATHGLFRRDNPMFSSIRLGNSQLRLMDLYQLRLSAELVTLSGCGTGLNVVVGGDELLGLARGLLYAGARAVLVTLWDVDDASTADFMKNFYEQLPGTANKAVALQSAMQALRRTHEHPYYWAPFVLIGKFT